MRMTLQIANVPRNAVLFSALILSGCSLFGGGSSDLQEELRDQVRTIVVEPARAEAMLATIDRIDQLLTESATALTELRRQERLLFADYDSQPEDFEKLFADSSRKRQELQKTLLAVHLELKKQAMDDEWPSISQAQSRFVAARVDALVLDTLDSS